ncbi:hypothetical protein CASFOL_012857 [Castilleja foliolosa]|uniref:Uncharacterized protein n=1 Tax=Castilleja foliolosa TaxID=1961234 RepID=A0ABD3DJ18_9LAMI
MSLSKNSSESEETEIARIRFFYELIKHKNYGRSNVLDHREIFLASDLNSIYVRSMERVIFSCTKYLQLGLYEKTPKSLEMDSECFVERCKKCQLKEKSRSSLPSKMEKEGESIVAHCKRCKHFEKAPYSSPTKIENDGESIAECCKKCERFEKAPFSFSLSHGRVAMCCLKCKAESVVVRCLKCKHFERDPNSYPTRIEKDQVHATLATALEMIRKYDSKMKQNSLSSMKERRKYAKTLEARQTDELVWDVIKVAESNLKHSEYGQDSSTAEIRKDVNIVELNQAIAEVFNLLHVKTLKEAPNAFVTEKDRDKINEEFRNFAILKLEKKIFQLRNATSLFMNPTKKKRKREEVMWKEEEDKELIEKKQDHRMDPG